MGKACSKPGAVIADITGNRVFYCEHEDLTKHKPDFDRLLLSEDDLSRLFEVYCKIDQDLSGEIATWELLEHLRLERTKFTKRIFRMFDEDGSGQIDFREFVVSLWNYCTLGKPALIMFAFDLYDRDGSGAIDFGEVEMMLKEVYGRKYENNLQAQAIRKHVKAMYDKGNINVDQFTHFVRTHPALLFPAFELQTTIQTKILGNDFWNEKSATRLKLSSGEYVSINQILKAHINKAAFDTLVMTNQVVDARTSREDSMVKEKIKGALRTSGLSGERKFKKSMEKEMMQNIARRRADSAIDNDYNVDNNELSPKNNTSPVKKGNPAARSKLRSSINAVKAANKFKMVTSETTMRETFKIGQRPNVRKEKKSRERGERRSKQERKRNTRS